MMEWALEGNYFDLACNKETNTGFISFLFTVP